MPVAVCWLCPFFYLQLPFAGQGISSASVFLGLGWSPPEVSFWWILGGFILLALLLGRAFCGWTCPFGALLEYVDKLSLFARRFKLRSGSLIALKYLKYLKYLILMLFLGLAIWFGEAVFCRFCPGGAVFRGLAGYAVILALTVLAAVVLSIFFFGQRVWCVYLCPLAAFAGLFSKVQAWGIGVDQKRCDKCYHCEEACLMDVPIVEAYVQLDKELKDSDCTKCFECIEACPKGTLHFP